MIRPILYIMVIVISLGFSFLKVFPAYSSVEGRRASLAVLNSASDSVGEIKTLIGETKNEIMTIDSANLEKFDTFLPETIDEIRFVNNLFHIGISNNILLEDIRVEKKGEKPALDSEENIKKNELTVTSIYSSLSTPASRFSVATPKGKYVATKVHFSFSAPYKTALIFFDDIERSLGLINITALSFSHQEDKEVSRVGLTAVPYQYTLEFETYSLR